MKSENIQRSEILQRPVVLQSESLVGELEVSDSTGLWLQELAGLLSREMSLTAESTLYGWSVIALSLMIVNEWLFTPPCGNCQSLVPFSGCLPPEAQGNTFLTARSFRVSQCRN